MKEREGGRRRKKGNGEGMARGKEVDEKREKEIRGSERVSIVENRKRKGREGRVDEGEGRKV